MKRLFVYIVLLFPMLCPVYAFAQAEILNLRHWTAPEHTRIVLDTTEEVHFTSDKSENKILIKLDAVMMKTVPRELI